MAEAEAALARTELDGIRLELFLSCGVQDSLEGSRPELQAYLEAIQKPKRVTTKAASS